MKYDVLLMSLLLGFGAATLAACGEGTECGPNTFEVDGECHSNTGVVCAGGAVADGQKCVVDDQGCGPGTRYDEKAEVCVPSEEACKGLKEQTSFVDGRCVAVSICSSQTARVEGDKCVPKFRCSEQGAVQPNPETGQCEIAAPACGSGTALSAQGTCVIDESACGDGLALSGETGRCVPSEDVCTDGLALSEEGRCEPTDEVCGDDTTFDEEMGLCVPDERCSMGDVVVDGVCLSPAEELAADPDVTESENDDPRYGGSPATLQPASSNGESTVFTGTIDAPSDLDGDGTADQDRDFFEFTASEGDWFQLAVQSTGLPQPNVLVTGPEGYRRFADNGVGRAATRDLAIPHDGTYRVRIVPHSTVSRPNYDPVGQSDWSYVGSLTTLETPAAQTVDFSSGNATGEGKDLTDNLYRVTGFPNGGLVRFSAPDLGADLEAELSIWSTTTDFATSLPLEGGETNVVISPQTSSGDFLVLVDWLHRRGPRDDYELAADGAGAVEMLGDVPVDGSVESTSRTVSDVYNYVFNVQAGQILEVTQTNANNDTANYELHRRNGDVVDARVLDDRSSLPHDVGYWYAEETTTFYASFSPVDSGSSLDDLKVRIRSITPDDLGTGGPGDNLEGSFGNRNVEAGYSAFTRFELTDAVEIDGDVETDLGSRVDVELLRTDFQRVFSTADRSGNPPVESLRIESGTVLLRVEPNSSTMTQYAPDLQLSTAALEETEPNQDFATASPAEIGRRHLGRLEDGQEDYFTFDVQQAFDSDEVLQLDLAERSNISPPPTGFTCRLLDENGTLLVRKEGKAGGCALFEPELDAGTYYVHVAYDRPGGGGIGPSFPRVTNYLMNLSRVDGFAESDSNNQRSNADPVDYASFESGHHVFGELTESDATDWFQIDLPNATGPETYLAFDIEMFGPIPPDKTSIALFDANGNRLARGDTRLGGVDGVAARDLAAGPHYLRVDAPSSFVREGNNGQYRIAFDRTLTPDKSASPGSGASLPTTIPDDDSGGLSNTVSISDACTIDRVDIEVDIAHSSPGDLELTVEAPDGTSVVLRSQRGSPHGDIQNVYSLGAEARDSLSNLVGDPADGPWTLTAVDNTPGSVGELNDWRVNVDCQ